MSFAGGLRGFQMSNSIKYLNKLLKYKDDSDSSVTYKLNKVRGVFNWYPYTEGFSKEFVDNMLKYYEITDKNFVLDPFGGCGTTSLACSLNGIPSISIEVNSFMDFVLNAKINSLKLDVQNLDKTLYKIENIIRTNPIANLELPVFLNNDKFFHIKNLKQAVQIKKVIESLGMDNHVKNFFLLCICSLIVRISNMKRATDLRYKEIKPEALNVYNLFHEKSINAINDLKNLKDSKKAKVYSINADIKKDTHLFKKFFASFCVNFFCDHVMLLDFANTF